MRNDAVHDIEAFGPVSTIISYNGIDEALALAARGKGSLVSTLVTKDPATAAYAVPMAAASHGRVLILEREASVDSTGHGSPLPQLKHGGPGRAGGGEELGGIRAVRHFLQRAAVQGSPTMLAAVTGEYVRGAKVQESEVHPFRRYFEDLKMGDSLLTHRRTVTEADIVNFGGVSGDYFYMHFDDIAAKDTQFGKRIAHGYFVLSAAAGLFVSPAPGPVLANYGLDNLRFITPVAIGDTIRARLTCKRKVDRNRTDDKGVGPGRGRMGCASDQPERRTGGQLRHPDAGDEARLKVVSGGYWFAGSSAASSLISPLSSSASSAGFRGDSISRSLSTCAATARSISSSPAGVRRTSRLRASAGLGTRSTSALASSRCSR